MQIDRQSIVFRLLIPIFGAIILIFLALLLLVSRISDDILDEYMNSTLSSYNTDVQRVLDTAIAELSTARLLDNRTVVEAKQRAVLESISFRWVRQRIAGAVLGPDGEVLLSTMPDTEAERVLPFSDKGHFHVDSPKGRLHGQSSDFAPWNWRIVTTTRALEDEPTRKEVMLLVPIVSLGALLILATLFLILHRNLRRPVAVMVADVLGEGAVAPTGVTELDQIGTAINDALSRVRERTAAILEKDDRIRLLLSSTGEGIYGVDTEGVCIFSNPAALRMLGYDREEDLLGKSTHDVFHHTRADGRPYPVQDCMIYSAYQVGKGVHADHEVFWRRDGSSFPVEYWSFPVIKEGVVQGAVVTFIDIAERKRNEAALREEKNKFEAVISAMGDGISIQDRDYRVLFQNEVHKGFVGNHEGEFCFQAYESKQDQCEGCPVAATYTDGKVHTVVRAVEYPEGIKYFEITSSPLRDVSGTIVAGIELVRDVTERHRTESQLLQAQKMEAIGQLAGGIAHDFNNILTAITGYASFLKLRTKEGDQLWSYSDQILLAAEKAANLTRQILAFSRRQVLAQRPVGINDIIRGMEKILLRLLGEDIDICLNLTEQDTTVLADPGQVEQVLLNLATNARDAMPAGGRLHVGTEVLDTDDASARSHNLARSGRYVLMTISDTGMGMNEQVRQRIFEPFFTTKEMGRGTGLGLAIVYGVVTQHEGQINVYSEPSEGTTFRIYLPLMRKAEDAATVETSAGELPKGSETVLLAEDDDTVRAIARMTLEEAGYRVIEARDGEDAVRKFREHRDAVQLCLFDVIMPKKNGKAALDEIRALRPGIRAVFMSGYAADVIRSRDIVDSDIELLAKPISPLNMLQKVRAILDA